MAAASSAFDVAGSSSTQISNDNTTNVPVPNTNDAATSTITSTTPTISAGSSEAPVSSTNQTSVKDTNNANDAPQEDINAANNNTTTTAGPSSSDKPPQPRSYANATAGNGAPEEDDLMHDKHATSLPLIFISAPTTGWTQAIKTATIKAFMDIVPARSIRQFDSTRTQVTFAVALKEEDVQSILAAHQHLVVNTHSLKLWSTIKRPHNHTPFSYEKPTNVKIRLRNLPIGYTKPMIKAALNDLGADVQRVFPDKLRIDGVETSIWESSAVAYVAPTSKVLPEHGVMLKRKFQISDPRDHTAAAQRKATYEMKQERKRKAPEHSNNTIDPETHTSDHAANPSPTGAPAIPQPPAAAKPVAIALDEAVPFIEATNKAKKHKKGSRPPSPINPLTEMQQDSKPVPLTGDQLDARMAQLNGMDVHTNNDNDNDNDNDEMDTDAAAGNGGGGSPSSS